MPFVKIGSAGFLSAAAEDEEEEEEEERTGAEIREVIFVVVLEVGYQAQIRQSARARQPAMWVLVLRVQ